MTDMTAEQIAALAAQDTPPVPPATNGDIPQGEPPAPPATPVVPAGDLTLEDMQIAMLSATEVTFKNGRSLPIVKFTDANGDQVTSLANATCAHAGDGSISIPLVSVPIAR